MNPPSHAITTCLFGQANVAGDGFVKLAVAIPEVGILLVGVRFTLAVGIPDTISQHNIHGLEKI